MTTKDQIMYGDGDGDGDEAYKKQVIFFSCENSKCENGNLNLMPVYCECIQRFIALGYKRSLNCPFNIFAREKNVRNRYQDE